MRKLIESTLVSLDGVIGSPDRWSPFDGESRQLANEGLKKYDALVLGRVTYEFFRANWGVPTGDPYIDQINAIPKYVASRTLTEATWNAIPLGPDIVGAIEQLKARPGKDLFKMGTGRVDDTLLRAPHRRTPPMGHARRGRHRPALVRRRRHLVPEAHARGRPQARQQLGHPHLRPQLTLGPGAVRSEANGAAAGPSSWLTTPKTCNPREQGGVSLRFASLRALLCGPTREEGCAPWFARNAGRIGRVAGARRSLCECRHCRRRGTSAFTQS